MFAFLLTETVNDIYEAVSLLRISVLLCCLVLDFFLSQNSSDTIVVLSRFRSLSLSLSPTLFSPQLFFFTIFCTLDCMLACTCDTLKRETNGNSFMLQTGISLKNIQLEDRNSKGKKWRERESKKNGRGRERKQERKSGITKTIATYCYFWLDYFLY